jgi:hypothetical protein
MFTNLVETRYLQNLLCTIVSALRHAQVTGPWRASGLTSAPKADWDCAEAILKGLQGCGWRVRVIRFPEALHHIRSGRELLPEARQNIQASIFPHPPSLDVLFLVRTTTLHSQQVLNNFPQHRQTLNSPKKSPDWELKEERHTLRALPFQFVQGYLQNS